MAKNILVVDDDRNMRLLYERELGSEEYRVIGAANARQALECYRNENPDLVVLDLHMPGGMDGLELLGRILSIDRRVPIVLVSSYSYYRDNYLSWAADAYVLKSSDLSELKNTVQQLLDSRPEVPDNQSSLTVVYEDCDATS
jgi:DNA-binding response OmpR family regulator